MRPIRAVLWFALFSTAGAGHADEAQTPEQKTETTVAIVLAACDDKAASEFDLCIRRLVNERLPQSATPEEKGALLVAIANARIEKLKSQIAALDARERECKKMGFVYGTPRVGMKSLQAVKCGWGIPLKVNRTTTAKQIREQWVYEDGYLYFTNGVLTTIQD